MSDSDRPKTTSKTAHKPTRPTTRPQGNIMPTADKTGTDTGLLRRWFVWDHGTGVLLFTVVDVPIQIRAQAIVVLLGLTGMWPGCRLDDWQVEEADNIVLTPLPWKPGDVPITYPMSAVAALRTQEDRSHRRYRWASLLDEKVRYEDLINQYEMVGGDK